MTCRVIRRLTDSAAVVLTVTAVAIDARVSPVLAAGPNCTSRTSFDRPLVGADGASPMTNTHLNGVSGDVHIPEQSLVNLNGQATTIADVAALIEDSPRRFFQAGWYVGSLNGLPTVSVPTAFVGEGSLISGAETLTRINVGLTVGSYVNFKLLQDENPISPTFRAYINGRLVWTSTMRTTGDATPRFLGESNWSCADMYALATTANNGPTLAAHHANVSWSLWQQHLDVRENIAGTLRACWYNTRINGLSATVLAGSYSSC